MTLGPFKRALILGAGASFPYGFPLGTTLTEQIVTHCPVVPSEDAIDDADFIERIERPRFAELANALRTSPWGSIDTLLSKRPDLAEVGTRAIAAILLKCEYDAVRTGNLVRNWYPLLCRRLSPNEEWAPDDTLIVTFNYDRSLELSFLQMLKSGFNWSWERATEQLSRLRIIHVYGQLDDDTPFECLRRSRPPGEPIPSTIRRAAKGIRTIHQDRALAPLSTASELPDLISRIPAIYFLGFGFHPTNLMRLGIHKDNPEWVKGQRRVQGTAFRLGPEPRRAAALTLKNTPNSNDILADPVVDCLKYIDGYLRWG